MVLLRLLRVGDVHKSASAQQADSEIFSNLLIFDAKINWAVNLREFQRFF
jgi:hypothetical protein